jgi:hypothetical protein
MKLTAVIVVALSFLGGSASVAFAQEPDPGRVSHWGIAGSLIPHWEFPRALADIWNLETDMTGSELRIGVVRGSDLGGDWGVSYVKKNVSEESIVQLRESACVQLPTGGPACARGPYHVTREAGFRGVEAHLFMPFTTIKRRVQIGATFAGGIAEMQGTSDVFIEHLVVNGTNATRSTETVGSAPFQTTLQDLPQDWDVVPIGRVELGVGIIAAPGFKIRLSTGVNFPGYHRIGVYAQYLVGAR